MRLARIAVFGLAIGLFGWATFLHWEAAWYRGKIPAGIEVGRALHIRSESDIREGCGAAVFQLSPAAAEQFRSRVSQHREPPDGYSKWEETPYLSMGDGLSTRDNWMNGLSCASMPSELNRVVSDALISPGAYYAQTHEATVIVIPIHGLVVFSFYG
jgi:hypothetical protein